MFAWFTRRLKNERGFTLVELLVVVVILGILAAIAVPQFMDKADEAREAAVKTDLKSMKNVIDMYRVENGEVPTAANNAEGSVSDILQDARINWTGGDDGIVDPWGQPYRYALNGTTGYFLYSLGPDGAVNDEEDDWIATERRNPYKEQLTAEKTGKVDSAS